MDLRRMAVSLAADCRFGGEDAAGDGQRAFVFVFREILVAGTAGETVRFADQGGHDDVDGHVEIADHPLDDQRLLRVLLAEDGDIRAGEIEQLQADRADAAEMDGAGKTAKRLRQRCFRYPCGEVRSVHVRRRGIEDGVHAAFAAEPFVPFEIARIFVKVFVGAELRGIDENGDDDLVRLRFGDVHEGEMAVMEIAHRGDEADGEVLFMPAVAQLADFSGSLADVHDSVIAGKVCASTSSRYCFRASAVYCARLVKTFAWRGTNVPRPRMSVTTCIWPSQ